MSPLVFHSIKYKECSSTYWPNFSIVFYRSLCAKKKSKNTLVRFVAVIKLRASEARSWLHTLWASGCASVSRCSAMGWSIGLIILQIKNMVERISCTISAIEMAGLLLWNTGHVTEYLKQWTDIWGRLAGFATVTDFLEENFEERWTGKMKQCLGALGHPTSTY